jgi:hypothetical protein
MTTRKRHKNNNQEGVEWIHSDAVGVHHRNGTVHRFVLALGGLRSGVSMFSCVRFAFFILFSSRVVFLSVSVSLGAGSGSQRFGSLQLMGDSGSGLAT